MVCIKDPTGQWLGSYPCNGDKYSFQREDSAEVLGTNVFYEDGWSNHHDAAETNTISNSEYQSQPEGSGAIE